MEVASWPPRRARKRGSGLYSTTCETPAARWRKPSQRRATDEETPETPVPARCDRRCRLRRAELSSGAIARGGDRPDRLRRRLGALAGLQHHRGTGVHRHSTQARRSQALSLAKTKAEISRAKAERAEMLFECDLGRKAASFEDAADGQPYLRVGGRGACCETYTHRTFGKPATFFYLFPAIQRRSCWFVVDLVTIYAIAARYVVAVRDSLARDDRQVVRVRGVVASNNDHQVQRTLQ